MGCAKIGKAEWAEDPRFVNNPMRVRHRDELLKLLNSVFRERETKEWLERLTGVVACGPINGIDDVMNDEHVKARGMVHEMKVESSPPVGTKDKVHEKEKKIEDEEKEEGSISLL